MAKKSMVARDDKRRELAAKYAPLRAQLKETIRNPKTSDEDRAEAWAKLRAIPRNANPIRIRNRCVLTGRPRAVHRKFGLSRITLRELAHKGQIPGMKKSSW